MFTMRFTTLDQASHDWRKEIARILRDVAASVDEKGHVGGPVHDSDGNRIGAWRYERVDNDDLSIIPEEGP